MADDAIRTGGPGATGQRSRQHTIAEVVLRRGTVGIDDLVAITGVSTMTIYRDIAALEDAGLVQRHRGRITAVATGLHEASAAFRVEQQGTAKQAMGALVAGWIHPGSSLLLDDSTSGVFLLRALTDKSPLTIVTNSLLVAREATEHPDWRLFVTGGEYQAWADALMGPTTLTTLAGIDADYCVLSASGISDGRCHHPYQDVAAVKSQMLACARTRILLLDHTKFARHALHAFARLDEFDHVVVDAEATPDQREQLADWGATVDVAG
ncbi:MAG: DeoR/GlpR family DNA-binding transcription regulator [Propionibacterium sp.]|nr:DeoR/GlpR family DNA-binding transcription regulator [Propionibacterium sp.]